MANCSSRSYFDFDDDGSFDEMLQYIRDHLASDEVEAMELLTEKVAEEFVWFNITSGKRAYLKDKNDVRCINPLGLSIPKKKRGNPAGHISKKKGSDSYKKSADLDDHEEEECIKRSTQKKTKAGKVDLVRSSLDKLYFSDEIKRRISWQEGIDKDLKLRITKRLFHTDTTKHHDRLSMPKNQIKDFDDKVFLKDDEEEELSKSKSDRSYKGIEVKLFDLVGGSLIVERMRLRKWDMNKSSSYMLTTCWHTVVERNTEVLHKNDFLQIYSFRRNEKPCFVVIKISDGEGCRDGAFGSSSNILINQGNGASRSGSQGNN